MKRAFESIPLRVVLRPLVAMLQLFGVYVYLHGHYSPGGGFQAGVLLACSVILPILVHGGEASRWYVIVGERAAAALASAGVLVFVLVGMVPLAIGRPLMDYSALPVGATTALARSYGILFIEIGVTMTVFGVILSIFYTLYGEEER